MQLVAVKAGYGFLENAPEKRLVSLQPRRRAVAGSFAGQHQIESEPGRGYHQPIVSIVAG